MNLFWEFKTKWDIQRFAQHSVFIIIAFCRTADSINIEMSCLYRLRRRIVLLWRWLMITTRMLNSSS